MESTTRRQIDNGVVVLTKSQFIIFNDISGHDEFSQIAIVLASRVLYSGSFVASEILLSLAIIELAIETATV
jgi:hypothetical protein